MTLLRVPLAQLHAHKLNTNKGFGESLNPDSRIPYMPVVRNDIPKGSSAADGSTADRLISTAVTLSVWTSCPCAYISHHNQSLCQSYSRLLRHLRVVVVKATAAAAGATRAHHQAPAHVSTTQHSRNTGRQERGKADPQ